MFSWDLFLDICEMKKGDILLLSSDVMKLYYCCKKDGIEFNMENFINSIVKRIGEEGTLLVPTYNWGFCKGEEFDYLHTRGASGALGNYVLQRSDFKRTLHPIYSFAVWGKEQDILCGLDYEDSFGKDSVFGFLHRCNAYNLLIDVDFNHSFTFLHYVEEMVGCSYRYKKQFLSIYRDADGNRSLKTCSMFVRKLDLDVHMVLEDSRFEDYLINAAETLIRKMGENVIRKVFFDRAFRAIEKDIKNNNSRNLLYYKGQ